MQDIEHSKRDAWNAAARRNAQFYIVDERKHWNKEDFFSSGAEDVDNFTNSLFKKMDFNPDGKKMLDIGCGLGRMTRAFSNIFSEAYGVDFSTELIEQAKGLNKDKTNLTFYANNGRDLSMFEDDFLGFCFSYIVFQHISKMDIIENYIKEISRIMKPGGLFIIQLRSRYRFAGRIPLPRFITNSIIRTGLLENSTLTSIIASLLRRDNIKIIAYPGLSITQGKMERILEAVPLKATYVTTKEGLWCSGNKAL